MDALVMGSLCAGAALGLVLVVAGLRGIPILPDTRPAFPAGMAPDRILAWSSGGVIAGVTVLVLTGWPVAAVATCVSVLWAPRLLGGKAQRQHSIARTEAIAAWAELIRDNMAGAAGLERALVTSASVCPEAIAPQLRRFANRLDTEPLADALGALGDDLDHPSSDLIVAALANAARTESRDVAGLLSRLAESIRADVRMRLRVEVGRARIRTSARIVIAVTVFTMLFLYLFSRSLLEPYDTLAGQLWLLVVFAVFGFGLWLMEAYSGLEMPERFSARRRPDRNGSSR